RSQKAGPVDVPLCEAKPRTAIRRRDCTTPAVACTLDQPAARRRLQEFRILFDRAYLTGERLGDGRVRWRFRESDGLLEEMQDLARREHKCCSFLEFTLSVSGSEIWWDTAAGAHARTALTEFFRLPETLTSGEQLVSLAHALPSVPNALARPNDD
ncbi:MAG: hypothetical protein AAFQ82_11245, partial [Myxococcota bacterium]